MGDLFKWLIGAIISYIIGTFITKKVTGKHVHQHVYDWYRHIHNKVTKWLRAHPEMKGAKILLNVVMPKIDSTVTFAARTASALRQKGMHGIKRVGETVTEFGTEEKRGIVMEEDISLDDLPGLASTAGVRFLHDIDEVQTETEVVPVESMTTTEKAKQAKPGHVFVEITAHKKGLRRRRITEEEVPVEELHKMFPKTKTAAPGTPIPITL